MRVSAAAGIRSRIALLLSLANRASDDGNKVLSHKMATRAERLIDKLYG